MARRGVIIIAHQHGSNNGSRFSRGGGECRSGGSGRGGRRRRPGSDGGGMVVGGEAGVAGVTGGVGDGD